MRACVETLESRTLLTSIVFSHHRLGVAGAGNYPNTITFGLSPDGLSITAQILVQTPKRTLNFVKSFPLSGGIRQVIIRGGNRDDLITVDQTNGSFPIPCKMMGGGGYDTILGGDEPDIMFGQGGNDYLSGGAGDDILLGQTGEDTLIGGPGNDLLAGSFGNDDMVGGDGNDTLADGRGADTALGGAGNNVFYIRSFKLDHVNDFDKSKDKIHYVTNNATNGASTPSFLQSVFPIFSFL
jgi:Ca2+-binding RTX toxin-like protein